MKNRSRIILALLVVLAIGMSALSYFGIGSNSFLGVKNIKQGLDLQGGVSIIYEADKANPPSSEMNAAVGLIRGRLDRKGWTEAEVSQQGSSRILVEIPGVEDAESAVREVGQTAQLTFQDEAGNELIRGYEHVKDAYKRAQQSQTGGAVEYVVVLEFTGEGKDLFAQATADNVGKRIAIVLDAEIISNPTVNAAISDGTAIITGGFTAESSEELAQLIKAGSLPFDLKVISMNMVGARLGADSLSQSLLGGFIGAVLVLLFMVFMYKFSGLAADLALIIYIALELLILSLLGITLTLPGIAGIILSIGMAVDANVIIFERLKEEIQNGRTVKFAIDAAFKRAFSAIIDGNVTTLISAAVLFWLGTGPIKGFAQTLAIGILLSMFTAIFVTRLILKSMLGAGLKNPKHYEPRFKDLVAVRGGDAE